MLYTKIGRCGLIFVIFICGLTGCGVNYYPKETERPEEEEQELKQVKQEKQEEQEVRYFCSGYGKAEWGMTLEQLQSVVKIDGHWPNEIIYIDTKDEGFVTCVVKGITCSICYENDPAIRRIRYHFYTNKLFMIDILYSFIIDNEPYSTLVNKAKNKYGEPLKSYEHSYVLGVSEACFPVTCWKPEGAIVKIYGISYLDDGGLYCGHKTELYSTKIVEEIRKDVELEKQEKSEKEQREKDKAVEELEF